MLVDVVLCCNLWRLKVCYRWRHPDLQLHIMNCHYLHTQRFWKNLPTPLLALLWFLYFWIGGLETQRGNMLNAVSQTKFIDVCKLVILFFDILPHFYDQITRNEMSLMNAYWMQFHPLSNKLIIGFKRPVYIIDNCQYKNPTCYLIQTIHCQFLSSMSHLVWSLWC